MTKRANAIALYHSPVHSIPPASPPLMRHPRAVPHRALAGAAM